MGTHPIFESDFDCLTEWEGLARDHVAEERKEILLLLALAPLHLRARLHPHHLHQDHQDRPLIDVEEKILDDVVHRHPVEDDVDLLHPDAVAHQVFHVDHVRHRRDAVRLVEGRLQDGLHLAGEDLLLLDADHLDVDPLRRRSPPRRSPPPRSRRSRSRSPARKRSPTPPPAEPTRINVSKLTRNITRDHLTEIFGTYGKIVTVDLPGGSGMSFTFRHSATIEFESHEDAAKAVKYMDGGQLDGQEVMVTAVKPSRGDRMRKRSRSPRRGGGAGGRRRSPGRRSRSPVRKRSPPARRRRNSARSSSSDGSD